MEITLGKELRRGGQTHIAVQRDGQKGLGPGAALLEIARAAQQPVQGRQGEGAEAGDPDIVQIEIIHGDAGGHRFRILDSIGDRRHQQQGVGRQLAAQ